MLRPDSVNEARGEVPRRTLLKAVGAAGLAAGGLGAGSIGLIQPAAATGTVIDDFDDGDLSEYTVYREGPATITSSPTYSGVGALKIDGTSADCVSMSGLSSYPSAGDTFSTRVRWTANAAGVIVAYGLQTYVEYSDQEYYYALIRPDVDQVAFKKIDLGGVTTLDKNFSVGLTADSWYELEVDWQADGTHTLTLLDETGTQVTQLTANDPTWTSGGIGFFGRELNSGATVYFDDANITSSQPAPVTNPIDQFEDSNLDEYTIYREGPATITSSPTFAGAGALKIDGTSADCVSMSGLPDYPEAGDSFSVRMRWTSNAYGVILAYGIQTYVEYSDQEYYYVLIRPDADEVAFKKIDLSGVTTLEKNYDVGLSPDSWYELEVDWQTDGTHVITLYDASGAEITQLTASDSTWTAGGIGFFGREINSGATVYFDETVLYSQGDAPEVLETFEDGDLSEYVGDTANFTVQSANVLEGTYSLEGTIVDSQIATGSIPTPRGYEYRCHVQAASTSGATPALVVGDQDPANPFQDAYFVRVDPGANQLTLGRREAGSTVTIESVGGSLGEGTEYQLALEYLEHAIRGVVYDAAGTELAATTAHPDTTYAGGYLGFDTGGGQPAYFDYATKRVPQWYTCER